MKNARLKSFVKFEKCSLWKAPRVINPRDTEYNLVLGKYLKKNEHAYFDAIAKAWGQDCVVFKGMTVQQCGKQVKELWDLVHDPVAIGGDAKKFDMHVSLEALVYEHLFYLAPFFNNDIDAARRFYDAKRVEYANLNEMPEDSDVNRLAWLLTQQLQNRGTAWFEDGKLQFKMRGTRASGDLNTSLGNSILMSAMTWCWSIVSRVPIKFINNGDDCVYLMERQHENAWRTGMNEWFAGKGFRMEFEPTVDTIEEIEFCQSHPVLIEGEYQMVRNVSTALKKASMCLLSQGNNVLRKWMMAVGLAEGYLGNGVPVMQSFSQAYRRNGLRCSQGLRNQVNYLSNMYEDNKDGKLNLVENISNETRLSFYRAFGLLPDAQVALEDHFKIWSFTDKYGAEIEQWDAASRATVPIAPVMHLL
jgi:hypothetical protein